MCFKAELLPLRLVGIDAIMYYNLSYVSSNTAPSDSSKSPYAKRQLEPGDSKENSWEYLNFEANTHELSYCTTCDSYIY